MATKNDGGPAFPRPYSEDKLNKEQLPAQRGMSLRTWLAGQALAEWHTTKLARQRRPPGRSKWRTPCWPSCRRSKDEKKL